MSDIDKVIDRVRKLLALAGNNTSSAEATVAAAMANKLIEEHRLSTADLEGKEDSFVEPIVEADDYVYQSGRINPWKANLVRVLTRFYGCAYWNDCTWEITGRQVSRYRLVGRQSDIQLVNFMYAWLSTECTRLSASEAKGRGRVFVASYCEGFVDGINIQFKASRLQAQATATSAAIVKIDARGEESKTALYNMHTNLRTKKSSSYSQRDGQAFAAGQSRGKSVHLGASIGSGGTKLLNG
jgi:hypothetical protein